MKKIFLITFVLIISSIISYGQSNYNVIVNYNDYSVADKQPIFSEPFDNNVRLWATDNDWVACKIENSHYTIKCKNYKSQAGMSSILISFDNTKDYEIETKINFVKGNGAFIFGMSKNFNHFRIEIADNKKLTITKNIITKDKIEKLFSKTISDLIIKKDYNKITIRKISNKFYFFLNEELVAELYDIIFFDNNFGYYVDLESEINIDFLNISYIFKKSVTGIVSNKFPVLVVSKPSFTDQNYNNFINAEEKCNISFSITNEGEGVAKNVKVKTFNKVPITGLEYTDLINVGDIYPDSTFKITIPIFGKLDLISSKANFNISFDEASGFIPKPIDISVETKKFDEPFVKIVDYKITSKTGKIENNLPIDLNVAIQNTGIGNAESVTIDFILPKDNVFNNNEKHYDIPFLATKESIILKFQFTASGLYENPTIPIEIKINEKHGKYSENKTVEATLNTTAGITVDIIGGYQPQNNDTTTFSFSPDVDKNIPESGIVNSNRFALIIGNENYKTNGGIQADVPFAINDAQIFKQYAIKTLGIPEINIKYLEDATATKMKTQIDLFIALMDIAPEKREFYIFYAGHGYPNENKDAYLMPVDISVDYIEDAIILSDLYQKLTKKSPKRVTIFLDACFSGGGRTGDDLVAARGDIIIKPKKTTLTGNLVIFAASSEDQVSKAYPEKQHGMFSYFLFKTLQDYKGDITYGQLADELNEKVRTYSININNSIQEPKVNVSKNVEDIWETWTLK